MKTGNGYVLMLVIAFFFSALASCNRYAPDGPAAAALEFSEYFAEGDVEKAAEMVQGYHSLPHTEQHQLTMFMTQVRLEMRQYGGIESFQIMEEEIYDDGERAYVKIKTTYGNGDTEINTEAMVKTPQGWKMALYASDKQ